MCDEFQLISSQWKLQMHIYLFTVKQISNATKWNTNSRAHFSPSHGYNVEHQSCSLHAIKETQFDTVFERFFCYEHPHMEKSTFRKKFLMRSSSTQWEIIFDYWHKLKWKISFIENFFKIQIKFSVWHKIIF
jgi:hypothetical protein